MTLEDVRAPAAAAWIFVAGIAGMALNVTSLAAAALLAGTALGPPLIMLLVWRKAPR